MATSQCAPLPTGGYEIEFVDSIPDSLSCPICLLPFRDPHILSCCGAKYCEVCIGRVKASGQPCPLCKEQFFSMLDKSFQRKVLGLKARCSRKDDGCQWEGELRHLDHHEREECMCALVECRYSCGVCAPRRQLVEHERDLCPQRPMDVKLESFMVKMEAQLTIERKRHEQEMAAIRGVLHEERESHRQEIESKEMAHSTEIEELKQELMEKFNAEIKHMILAEQKKIKDEYASKMEEMVESHTAETAALQEEFKREMERKLAEQKENIDEYADKIKEVVKTTEEFRKEIERKLSEHNEDKKDEYSSKKEMEESLLRVKKIEELIPHIRGTLVTSYHYPVEFIMTKYTKHKRDDDAWYSSPFYTGPGGYKMCISVDANGRGRGAGTHVTVSAHLMRGEYDDWLVWPFRGDITIQVMNQNSDQDHVEKTVFFNNFASESSQRVMVKERALTGMGHSQFISHLKLQFTTTQYLKNDCLKFRVTKIVVHSV